MSRDNVEYLLELIKYRLTVPPLKEMLKYVGLASSGRKDDLRSRLLEFIEKNGPNYFLQMDTIQTEIRKKGEDDQRQLLYERQREAQRKEQENEARRRKLSILNSAAAIRNLHDYDSPNSTPSHSIVDFFESRHTPTKTIKSRQVITEGDFPSILWGGLECSTLDINWMIFPFYEQLRVLKSYCIKGSSQKCHHTFNLTAGEFADISLGRKSVIFCMTNLFAAFLSTRRANGVKPSCLLEYPFSFSIKVNGEEIIFKGHGIKDKPGSCSPIDIGKLLISGENHIIFPFNGFSKLIVSYLFAKVFSVDDLVEKVSTFPPFPMNSKVELIKSIKNAINDEDIQLGENNFILKLNDPLTLSRIEKPVLSTICNHIQPFDCEIFFQSQKNFPLFKCPICRRQLGEQKLTLSSFDLPDSIRLELQNFSVGKYFRTNPVFYLRCDNFTTSILKVCSNHKGIAYSYKGKTINSVKLNPDGTWEVNEIDEDSDFSPLEESLSEAGDDLPSSTHDIPLSQVEHEDEDIVLVDAVSTEELYRRRQEQHIIEIL
eukprot:NODE_20_length_44879_cov_0.624654.p7 type:complete len:543 gc:universal NODE_20_length_44879_cov_0.624654:20446-22074(+)